MPESDPTVLEGLVVATIETDNPPRLLCTLRRWPKGEAATMVEKHNVASGASLQVGADGERWFSSSCTCGWSSELCRTGVLAEALAEQHVTLTTRRPEAES